MWEQWLGLMTKISANVTNDLVCNSQTGDFNHNFCYLTQSCSTPAYSKLWNYVFNIDFSLKKPTMNIGLGSLAVDYAGVCMLDVRGNEIEQNVIIGAFALQNFNVLFNNTDPSGNFTANIIVS